MGTIGDQLNAIKELSLTIHHAYSTSEYASLCSIFQFGSETFDALTQTLQNASDVSSCTNVIESSSLRKFADEYFKLLSAYEESTPMERWKLMASVFSSFVELYRDPKHEDLTPIFTSMLYFIPKVLKEIPPESEVACYDQFGQMLSSLVTSINVAMRNRDKSLPLTPKIQTIFLIAAFLALVGMKIGNPRAAGNVIGMIHNEELSIDNAVKSYQVLYNYWSGRYYLSAYKFREASDRLIDAFSVCPRDHPNKRIILKYLIVSGLICGKVVRDEVLQEFNLVEPFYYLYHHFKQGNVAAFGDVLDQYMDYFRSMGVYTMLRERAELLMYRNLVMWCYKLKDENRNGIFYRDLIPVFELATGRSDIDDTFVESVLVSLISQGYVNGRVVHQSRGMSFGRQLRQSIYDVFPRISEVSIIGHFRDLASLPSDLM